MKKVLTFILNFILSLSILFIMILSIFENILLNTDHVKKTLAQNNYYEDVYQNIIDNFENNLMESGLDIKEITDTISQEEVKQDIDNTLSALIDNQKLGLSDENLKQRIDDKINVALTNSNRTPSLEEKKDIARLENTLIEIYKDEITIMPSLIPKISNAINKLKPIITIAKTIVLILMVMLVILNVKLHKNFFKELGTCLFTSGLISLGINVLIGNGYKTILIISQTFSNLLIEFIKKFTSGILIGGILMIILGIIFIIINTLKDSKKNN